MKKIISFILAGLLLICLFSISACTTGRAQDEEENDPDELKLTFIDVGKGDAILIEKDGTNILVDTGYEETAETVISFLENEGIDHLDHLIISHYDKDHVGGAAKIAEAFEIGQIYLPDYEGESKYYSSFMKAISKYGLSYLRVSEDITLEFSGVTLVIYASDVEYEPGTDGDEGNDNDVSLVTAVYYGEDSYLLAGDIEKKGIKSYLKKDAGQFDVIKMPHHGTKESNSDDLIESVAPKIAVITDSTETTADDKVLKLLAENDTDVYQTSVCGNIVIAGNGTGVYNVST